mgnify:CR=1 FL=1
MRMKDKFYTIRTLGNCDPDSVRADAKELCVKVNLGAAGATDVAEFLARSKLAQEAWEYWAPKMLKAENRNTI